jgi:hypothetical protein
VLSHLSRIELLLLWLLPFISFERSASVFILAG